MSFEVSRRRFLQLMGAGGAGAALALRGIPTLAQDEIVLRVWDHYQPLQPLVDSVWTAYLAQNHPNVRLEHTMYSPPDVAQSLQLAFPAGQAPDIHSIADIRTPLPALVDDGWFTPLEPYVSAEWLASLPAESRLEGFTQFRGVLYSFPLFSSRWHINLNWFNKEMMEEAGYDPVNGPTTWDEFRDAANKMTANGGGMSFGWIQGHAHIDRNAGNLINFAQIAGAPGEIDWATGEYTYGSDAFVTALEFMVSLARDGALLPGSTSLDTRNARARWAAGAAGQFLDGPWNPGVVVNNFPEFAEAYSVGQIPVLEAEQTPIISRRPNAGDFWISSQSEHPQIAAELLQLMTSEEFQVGLAERMDQPPLSSAAIAAANVHPMYRRGLDLLAASTRIEPVPEIKNTAVVEVRSRMTEIRPNLGEIVQGAITGDVSDIRAALQGYQDAVSANRDQAIRAAQAAGFTVSLDDWVFPNWERGTDYTNDFYAAL